MVSDASRETGFIGVTFMEMLDAPCGAPFELTVERFSEGPCSVTLTDEDITTEELDEHCEKVFVVTQVSPEEALVKVAGDTTFAEALDISGETTT